MKHADVVARWFDGLNRGDLADLLELFAATANIKNAANPPLAGPDAAKRLLEDFLDRTRSRHFEVIDMAELGDEVFAGWAGKLVFRKGATVAGRVLPKEVEVELHGADWFKLDNTGRIKQLLIAHETTTLAIAASKAAEPERTSS